MALIPKEYQCILRICNIIYLYLHFSLFERVSKLVPRRANSENDDSDAGQIYIRNHRTPPLHQIPGTRKVSWKTTMYVVLVLLAGALPITQLLLGHHYVQIDKTHASRFLIANGVVYCYLFILGLFKVSKRCVNPYKCCLTLFFIPLVVAICIGFGLLADFHSWNIAYNEKDYKFCDPFIFIFAYGLNIIDYFIFSGYAITVIINHYCSRAIYCCGEIV